jgi:hypothetical protein
VSRAWNTDALVAFAELDDEHPILVPQLDREVSDAAGLVIVQRFLFAPPRESAALLSAQAF